MKVKIRDLKRIRKPSFNLPSRSILDQQIVADMVISNRTANDFWRSSRCCRSTDGLSWTRFGDSRCRSDRYRLSYRILLRLRCGHFDIDGVNEGRQRYIAIVVCLRPQPKNEADDGCGRDCHEPRRHMEMAMTVPRADVQLGVLFVTQLTSGVDDVLIIDFHIASIVV